jgi:hypothetical protein
MLRSFLTLIFCFILCSGLAAQTDALSEDSKQSILLITNGIRSVKTYTWQTNLKDSFKTDEVLNSSMEISRSKTGTVIKTLHFNPKEHLNIVEEWEEYYNKGLQRVKDVDKTNEYVSHITYEYNKTGMLTKEISIWSYDYAKHYDTTLYTYGKNKMLICLEKRSNTGHWALDSFFYEGANLIKKIHRIPIDTNPSVTIEEEYITHYFYENSLLIRSTSTFHYTDKSRLDSMYYENGILVKRVSLDYELSGFCNSRVEYTVDLAGNVILIIADMYPGGSRFEFYNLYDDRGLLISSTTVNHSIQKKFIHKYEYK